MKHSHPPHLVLVLTGGNVKVTTPEGKANIFDVPSGTVIWEEAATHSAESIGGSGTRMYIIEMKDRHWQPSTVDGWRNRILATPVSPFGEMHPFPVRSV